MFKNMKLAAKIGVGFGLLIVIAVILGGLAVVSMNGVKTTAKALAEQNVPEVGVANEVERNSLQTMYSARGYVYTEGKSFLDDATKNLGKVKQFLQDAKAHAAKYNIAVLKQNAEKAEAKALEYEKLLGDTVAKTEAMQKEKEASLVAADKYMKICAEYLDVQNKELEAGISDTLTNQAILANAVEAKAKLDDRIWKINTANDIVDLGNNIRIGTWEAIASRDPKLFQETEKLFDKVNAKLDELKAKTTVAANMQRIEDCRKAGQEYLGCMERFLKEWFDREQLNKDRGVVAQAVLEAAESTSRAGMDDTAKATAKAASSLSASSTIMIVGLCVAILVGILLAVFITRSITGPISKVIEGLSSGSEQVTSASGQVSSASQQLAQGASEQASSLEETSSALEEMASMTRQNADNANQANTMAKDANSTALEGVDSMKRMSEAIDKIKTSASETAKIIKTIDEIAFQTNLLALNAAVEAARAGEAGKGFAVVAEEVRNLARRSAEAAKNTADLIEGATKNAEAGVSVTGEVAKNLQKIQEVAAKVAALIAEIAAASKEQAQGIDQVNTAVSEMDKVVQQNAANAEESASASEQLSSQAQELSAMVVELTAIVGGAGSNGTGGSRQRTVPQELAKAVHKAPMARTALPEHRATPAAPRKRPAAAQAPAAKPVKPEEVIPLDDKEFKDF